MATYWNNGWGVVPDKGDALLCHGDGPEDHWMSAMTRYKKQRRAKKEITHYIQRGAARGPFHGIYRHFNKVTGRFFE